ncbi:MAG: DUF421 domain-containing protein [Gemmatimonadota bacterium]|nr:DUF421 domain-containing protein [Gemmatimonadota bacterium]
MSSLFWTSWAAVLRAVVLAVGGYVGLVLFLRIAGKRSTSKLNQFDWAVTVALGSMLATVALSTSIPLAVGLAAFATVIFLQFAIAWLSVRSETVRQFVKAEPTLLYFRGEYLRESMRSERIAEEEIRAAAREAGHGSMRSVEAVVLETDAELSVLERNVAGFGEENLQDVGAER